MENRILPKELKINLWDILGKGERNEQFWDMITDYLTETYGHCTYGYCLDEEITINISNIDWDRED